MKNYNQVPIEKYSCVYSVHCTVTVFHVCSYFTFSFSLEQFNFFSRSTESDNFVLYKTFLS